MGCFKRFTVILRRSLIICSTLSSQPQQILGQAWASTYLRTPEDYAEYCATHPDENVSPEAFRLDSDVAMQRLMDLSGDVFFQDQLCISPGTVHKANEYLIEHTATMMPQSSGGAGMVEHNC